MDDLRDWEIGLLIENISWATKNDWEQTRLIMYSALMPYMKKGVKKDAKGIIEIPELSPNGHLVVAIANNAFKGNLKISGIVFPAGRSAPVQ